MRMLTILLLLAACAGCTRPAAVRQVAKASQPVLTTIQSTAKPLRARFQEQREDFVASIASIERTRRLDSEIVLGRENVWGDIGNKDAAALLARYRAEDAAIRANPLASLTAASPETVKVNTIELGGLTKALSTMERLKRSEGLTSYDLIDFARDTSAELKKLEAEAEASAAAQSKDVAAPAQPGS
jgi:hypothetical protein